MHYADGREVQLGDVISAPGWMEPMRNIGVVGHVVPGSDACNVYYLPAIVAFGTIVSPFTPQQPFVATARECVLLARRDDLAPKT